MRRFSALEGWVSTLIVALVVVVVVSSYSFDAVEARPQYQPYMGLKQLGEPAVRDGKKASQNFKYSEENGLYIHLNYEVEHADEKIVNFDQDLEVESLECFEGFLRVECVSEEAAKTRSEEWIPGTLLAASRSWNCTDKNGKRTVVLAKVLATKPKGNYLEIVTKQALYHHFFKHAKVDFRMKRFPEDVQPAQPTNNKDSVEAEAEEATEGAEARRKFRRRGIGSFLSDTWDDVKSIGGEVNDIIDKTESTVHSIATGDFGPRSGTLSYPLIAYNYNSQTGKAQQSSIPIDSYVSCVDCFFHLDLDLSASFDIESYALKTLTITAGGSAALNVGLQVKSSGSWKNANSASLFELKTPEVTFIIGAIPFSVDFDIPITAGYSIDLEGEATIGASVNGEGSINFGISYNEGDSDVQRINSQTFKHSGVIPTVSAQIAATLQVYLLPAVKMTIDMIGGPYVGLKPYLEAALTLGTETSCGEHSSVAASATLNAGFTVSLGAEIDIELEGQTIYSHDFGSIGLYSKKEPIATGCVRVLSSSEAKRLSNFEWVHTSQGVEGAPSWVLCYEPFLSGLAYTGAANPSSSLAASAQDCTTFPNDLQLSFQIIEPINNGYLVIGSTNGLYGTNNWCITQVVYAFTYDNTSLTFSISPLTDNYGYADGYFMCSSNNNTQVFAYSLTGSAQDNTFAHLAGSTADGCASFQLDTPADPFGSTEGFKLAPQTFCSSGNGSSTGGSGSGTSSGSGSGSGFTATSTTNSYTSSGNSSSTGSSSTHSGSGSSASSGSSVPSGSSSTHTSGSSGSAPSGASGSSGSGSSSTHAGGSASSGSGASGSSGSGASGSSGPAGSSNYATSAYAGSSGSAGSGASGSAGSGASGSAGSGASGSSNSGTGSSNYGSSGSAGSAASTGAASSGGSSGGSTGSASSHSATGSGSTGTGSTGLGYGSETGYGSGNTGYTGYTTN